MSDSGVSILEREQELMQPGRSGRSGDREQSGTEYGGGSADFRTDDGRGVGVGAGTVELC